MVLRKSLLFIRSYGKLVPVILREGPSQCWSWSFSEKVQVNTGPGLPFSEKAEKVQVGAGPGHSPRKSKSMPVPVILREGPGHSSMDSVHRLADIAASTNTDSISALVCLRSR